MEKEQTKTRVSFVPIKRSTASLFMTLLVVPNEASMGCDDALDSLERELQEASGKGKKRH